MDQNYHTNFFEVVGENSYSTYTYDGVQKLKLLQLCVVPSSEINEMAARLKTSKIRKRQNKIFQN